MKFLGHLQRENYTMPQTSMRSIIAAEEEARMDNQLKLLQYELEQQKKLVRELLSGVINLQWLVLELLDEEKILDRRRVIAMLKEKLSELGPDLAQAPDSMPIRHLIRALSGPREDAPRRGWTPVVLPGGKDAPSEPQDPPGDR
jgi:hypothetical protein